MPILPTLLHRTPCALCSSIEKNTDSLVKGMTLCAQGGGEGRGGKVMVEIAVPRQSVVGLFFVVVAQRIFSDIFAVSKILAGNSPAGPPTSTILESHQKSQYWFATTTYKNESNHQHQCFGHGLCQHLSSGTPWRSGCRFMFNLPFICFSLSPNQTNSHFISVSYCSLFLGFLVVVMGHCH